MSDDFAAAARRGMAAIQPILDRVRRRPKPPDQETALRRALVDQIRSSAPPTPMPPEPPGTGDVGGAP